MYVASFFCFAKSFVKGGMPFVKSDWRPLCPHVLGLLRRGGGKVHTIFRPIWYTANAVANRCCFFSSSGGGGLYTSYQKLLCGMGLGMCCIITCTLYGYLCSCARFYRILYASEGSGPPAGRGLFLTAAVGVEVIDASVAGGMSSHDIIDLILPLNCLCVAITTHTYASSSGSID